MKYGKMKKAPSPFDGSTYDSPFSNVRSGGDTEGGGWIAGGLDIVKAVPGKGKKAATKTPKKARRAY